VRSRVVSGDCDFQLNVPVRARRRLELDVVAEGIETVEQARRSCDQTGNLASCGRLRRR
jgi:hypothetical protein